jgi:endonuclease/exonuclease/phosphatase family metal-dependent hydrolase
MRSSPLATLAVFALFRIAGYFTEPRLTPARIHAISGEPARVAPGQIDRRSIRLVSWNIERGVQFQEIVETLRSLTPDVVLLQEVDRFCRRSGSRDVARDLAHALGMNWVSAGEFQEVGESHSVRPALTGQAILSRDVITDAGSVVFRNQAMLGWQLNPFQPRRGGRMGLRAQTAGLLVYNVHLESLGRDALRERQLHEVLADQSRQRTTDVVVAGDFNNDAPLPAFPFAGLEQAGFVDALDAGDRRTSVNHQHPIDWVFVKDGMGHGGYTVPVDETSDHYPLVANVSRR